MTRREVFERLLIASAAAGAHGCASRRTQVVSARSLPHLKFPPVHVSADRVTRTTVGFRPFRPSGFVLGTEKLDSKLLVHNYGHGGGGMTLSWGTADLAVQMAAESGAREFAVLGAGGVGLATARLLQRRGAQVTIYAKSLPPDTTSNKSGAQWWPVSVFDRDKLTPAFRDVFLRAARLSYGHYQTMIGEEYGIRWVRNYLLTDEPPLEGLLLGKESPMRDLYPELRDLRQDEHPFASRHVRQFDTMMIEPPIYLNAMLRDFRIAGGKVVVGELRTKQEIAGLPEPVVMNCTGLGSRELVGDQELTPIKGQLSVLLPQPEIDYTVLQERFYMFPRRDGILLGGTFERGVSDPEPNREAEKSVIEAHQRIFAPLARG
ncbi:MAG TPA: FAD-dependent oxidoreductase [Bryobacteraceae bacterium]|nr:FAD-dependent oxidoreductase [Bryobacteraceae bacterium]